MSKKRYKEIKRKADLYDEISTEEYHIILKYERPEYYEILTNLLVNWEVMNQEKFSHLLDQLELQDQDYVMNHINTWDE